MNLDLSILSIEEAAIFETLIGKLEPPKKAARKVWGVKDAGPKIKSTLRPYKLKIVFCCRTCSHTTKTYFNMVPAGDGTGLVSVRTNDTSNPDCSNTRDTWICDHCKPYLMSKDKDQLVALLLSMLVRM